MNKFNVLALVLIAGISIRSVTASAENFVVEGGKNGVNKALNTNNKFSKIDGTPRMSLWDFSANDADQIFDISQGGLGGKLLKHRSQQFSLWKFCLNLAAAIAIVVNSVY